MDDRSEEEPPPDPATVASPVDPTVATDIAAATEFLYTGTRPIQTGVAPGTLEPRRAAVLRGRVIDRDGGPLAGVRITLLGHPELGRTLSREDGHFDLAVNGGGILTLQYERDGYLPVRRHVETPWRDYVWAEDVVLVPFDTEATVVSAGALGVQVARGGAITDEAGARRATLLFPAGVQAEMELPDGSLQPLSRMTVRATEYTVGPSGPAAMPAPLPPSSGYTYAVELSVDEAVAAGATRVTFSQPVPFYLENFLGFPVGSIVPAGYYDRQKAAWLPSRNGRVVKVLAITGGLADLDVDGSGAPADAAALDELGVDEAERRQLAALYAPGQSLWRVPIPHFTPWDCNWPFGPPEDAQEPPDPSDLDGDGEEDYDEEEDEDDPCRQSGSVIECENQILGESVPVVGTPFSLHYQSNRVPGRKTGLRIRVSSDSVPSRLRRIELMIDIAGQRVRQSFPAATGLVHTFYWDQKDAYGRVLQGRHPATVHVGFVYPAVYYTPLESQSSFGAFSSDLRVTGDRERQEVTLWRTRRRSLGTWDARMAEIGGWSLDVHHAYDPSSRTLYLGDGTRRTQDDLNQRVVHGVALSAVSNTNRTHDVATGADGSVYFVDLNLRMFSFVDSYITRVGGPDGPRRRYYASHEAVHGMGLAPDGTVYYAVCETTSGDRLPQVWRLPPNEERTLLLDGSQIGCPKDVAVERDGSLPPPAGRAR